MPVGYENYTMRAEDGTTNTYRNIPTATITKMRKEKGLTHSEAVITWLYDDGQIPELPISISNKLTGITKPEQKTRKPRTRKVDENRVDLIKYLAAALETLNTTSEVSITNTERVIAFTIGEDHFEITLSKKRAAK